MLVISEHALSRFSEKINELRYLDRKNLCKRIRYEYENGTPINIGIDKDFLVQLKTYPNFVFACKLDSGNTILKTVLSMDHAIANSQAFIRRDDGKS